MKRTTTITILTAALLAAFPMKAQTGRTTDTQFKAAEHKEQVEGDLKGAIEQYRKIAQSKDRSIAVQALIRMAECYQKMGDAESRKIYEQIVREYADQKDAVTLAHAKLGGAPGRPSSSLVWKGRKVDLSGSVSADGRFLSFVDWDTGDLGLHDVATGQDRSAVETKNNSREVFAQQSVFSPDGRQVAYGWWLSRGRRYELWIADLTGAPNPRRLYDDPRLGYLNPAWSPDGKSIAAMIGLKDGTHRLGFISVADGSLRVLKSGNWPGDTHIFFSPDGKHLGYDLPQGDAKNRDIWVTAADGTRDTAVVVQPGNDRMMGWSPDGKLLLFRSDRAGSMALWSLPISNGMPDGAPKMLKPDMGEAKPLGVTKDGAMFYGITTRNERNGTLQIGSFDFQSGAVVSPRAVSDDYLEENVTPCWSPDGKHLAYVTERSQSGRKIVIRSAETNRIVRELPDNFRSNPGLAGWEPGSRALLFGAQNREGKWGAFRVDVETGNSDLLFEIQATSAIPLFAPRWATDGRSVYYHRSLADGDEHVFIQREMASGREKEVIRRPFLGGIHPSPDGNFVATESVDPSRNEKLLLLVPLRGGEPREVMRIPADAPPAELKNTSKGARIVAMFWAPDSRSFIASKRRAPDSERELWQIPVEGGAPSKLDSVLEAHVAAFTLSPDGHKVAYRTRNAARQTRRVSEEVWVLENFLPTLAANK